MLAPSTKTGFARLRPSAARAVLVAIVLGAVACVAVTLSPMRSMATDRKVQGAGDVALYRAMVDRVQAGEAIYVAAEAEMVARGYPTASVFNWRTPAVHWMIGRFPGEAVSRLLLGGMALWLAGGAYVVVEAMGGTRRALLAAMLLSGALMPVAIGDLFVMPSVWAGVALGLSIVSWLRGRERATVAWGIAALVMRELVAVYCVVMVVRATWERRWRELSLWMAGGCAYLAFFAWHVSRVLPRIGEAAVAHDEGWVQFGGLAFVISTYQMNCYTLILPQWVTAVYFVAAMVGFASWSDGRAARVGLVVAAYAVAFGVVGQIFNQYWGVLLAPVVCLGAAQAPAAVRDLWQASGWRWPGRQRSYGAAA